MHSEAALERRKREQEEFMGRLSQIRAELVTILRNSVNVLNRSAGILPIPVQSILKNQILSLPFKFSTPADPSSLDTVTTLEKVHYLTAETMVMIGNVINILKSAIGQRA